MEKRGAIELSFGMIFSIIMIIAIIGVATYAIVYFVNLGKASELSLFHQKFQETIDEIWASSITDKVVSFTLPKGIEMVCFGNLSAQSWNPKYEKEYNEFIRYSSNFEKRTTNRFIYPTKRAGDFAYKKVNKIDLSELTGDRNNVHTDFECFEVRDRKIKVRFVKDTFDALVKIKRP